jgi:hypothetical protein
MTLGQDLLRSQVQWTVFACQDLLRMQHVAGVVRLKDNLQRVLQHPHDLAGALMALLDETTVEDAFENLREMTDWMERVRLYVNALNSWDTRVMADERS